MNEGLKECLPELPHPADSHDIQCTRHLSPRMPASDKNLDHSKVRQRLDLSL